MYTLLNEIKDVNTLIKIKKQADINSMDCGKHNVCCLKTIKQCANHISQKRLQKELGDE